MAEGLARKILGNGVKIESAGSKPSTVNAFAIKVMQEIGIDISGHHSKSFEQLNLGFLANLTFVITLCAEEVCPVLISKAKKLHWPLLDPAGKGGDDETQLEHFREIRDALKTRIMRFAKEKETL
jgi:arsenate reductase